MRPLGNDVFEQSSRKRQRGGEEQGMPSVPRAGTATKDLVS